MKCDASVAIQYQRSRKETYAKGLFSKNYLLLDEFAHWSSFGFVN